MTIASRVFRPSPLILALSWAAFGAACVLLADLIAPWLATTGGDRLAAWGLVLVSSLALWLVLRRQARALKAAQRSAMRLRRAVAAAGGFAWQAEPDPSGEVGLRLGAALAQRIGLPHTGAAGRAALLARAHAADRPALRDLVDRIAAGAPDLPEVLCRFAAAGQETGWRWIRIVPDAQGPGASPGGVAFDISDQQGALQDLAEVVAGGELGTWRLDLATGVNQINDRWAELIGYRREDLGVVTVDAWRQLVHPADLSALEESHLARVSRGDFFFADEFRMRHRDGHWVWILSRGRAVEFAADGTIAVLSGVHVDISRRKALESALRAERDFLHGLAETSVSGILAVDATGVVVFTNREAERVLGVTSAQMIGRRHDDKGWNATTPEGMPIPPEDFPFARVTRTGEILRDQRMKVRLPDGRARVISIHAAPMPSGAEGIQVVCSVTDITEQLQAEAALREAAEAALQAALHDPATGLPNRALLEQRLDQAIAQAQGDGGKLALIFLDIDNFKQVNDRFGHQLGDRLIAQVAARLGQVDRAGGFLARAAGDEFVCLQPCADVAQVTTALRDIGGVFEAPFVLDGREVFVGASMGLAIFPEDAPDSAGLWRNADLAMHEAKGRGRGQVVRFSGDLRARLDREARIAQGLRGALRDRAFQLVLQPKVALQGSGRIVGAEVLLRCTDPALSGIGPGEFMPVAERHGLIRAIDLMVVDMVGRVVATLKARGLRLPLSVNLSPESLREPDFADALLAQLAAAWLEPPDLVFELTEGAMLDMTSGAREAVEALLARGYDLSADDFGTGYSSLSYLHELRLKELKIDRSFVARLGQERGGAPAIVRAIIAMAAALGLRVVAEGVEDRAQAEWLRAAGCAVGQGFHFGRAVGVEAFLDLCAAEAEVG